MSYKLKILPEADKEYQRAAVWYEKQQKGLGNKFIIALEAKLKQISQSPKQYPKRKENFREAFVEVFPFAIVFTIHKKDRIITISSIFHTSRNPQKKYRRKK